MSHWPDDMYGDDEMYGDRERPWYDIAEICTNGHVTNEATKLRPQHNQTHCEKCGAATITKCPTCNTDIRGEYHSDVIMLGLAFPTPPFCITCGEPFPWTKAKLDAARELAMEQDGLAPEEQEQLAKSLPHGHQRILGIAMALAVRPRLLMLDEPVTGMNLDESLRVMQLVQTIRDRGTTILLVEHNMKAVMGTCERVIVLNFGQKLAEGTPAAVSSNPDVIAAYLGTGVTHA